MQQKKIKIIGAYEHNLKHINVQIPRNSFTVVTGVSGSGKSSLAFDTIYAEGQRRYIESLSSYARQFLDQLPKPKVELIDGLSPAISIEQRTISHNPRSTVGTITEIYDYVRLLFAHLGTPHCPKCGNPIARQSPREIVDYVMTLPEGSRLMILAPIIRGRKGEYSRLFEQLERDGFTRVVVDGTIRELGEKIALKKTYKHDISLVVDRLIVKPGIRPRLFDAVEIALRKSHGVVEIHLLPSSPSETPTIKVFSEQFSCPACGYALPELSPRLFSFNSPYGACPECKGIGTRLEAEPSLVVNPDRTINEGALLPWEPILSTRKSKGKGRLEQLIKKVARTHGIDLNTPFRRLSKKHRDIFLYGSGARSYTFQFRHCGRTVTETDSFEGVIPYLKRRLNETRSAATRDQILAYYAEVPCPQCHGDRLRPESLAVTLNGYNIAQLSRMTIKDLSMFFKDLNLSERDQKIGGEIVKEIRDRLKFLTDVGLSYLTLDRRASTLAGGEAQRTRLATQIGTQLVGVLYILDEPSIGLHQRDNHCLIETLKQIKSLGNTIIVVEHDEATIRSSDYIVDLGPGAGRLGGKLVVAGSPEKVERYPDSITGLYLRGGKRIPVPTKRRALTRGHSLTIKGAAEHNLKKIDVVIPLGIFTCITGVSGSGKSTLLLDVLYNALMRHLHGSALLPGKHTRIQGINKIDKVINIDQSPIGRTPRSNPSTYTGLWNHIRELYARVPESRMRGYTKSRFSFNLPGGRCEKCRGQGVIKIEMQFLPDVHIECEACKGKRFNPATLEVLYKGKNIADVLAMTVEEALDFFSAIPPIREKLSVLYNVGLGYITLGQAATTLSGGEAQRIKISRELSKRQTGKTLYILDEPTTGLHFDDVKNLLDVLNQLVEQGNTVLVIEHNLDVIKSADWIIDLGPEGGDDGGEIVDSGTPEKIARNPHSYTGQYLKKILKSAG